MNESWDSIKREVGHTHGTVPAGRVVVVADNGGVAHLQVLLAGRDDGHVGLGTETDVGDGLGTVGTVGTGAAARRGGIGTLLCTRTTGCGAASC